MTESNFRQERKKKVTPEEVGSLPEAKKPTEQGPPPPMVESPGEGNPLDQVHAFQREAGVSVGGQQQGHTPGEQQVGDILAKPMEGVSVTGKIPPAMQQALQQRISQVQQGDEDEMHMPPPVREMPDYELPPHQQQQPPMPDYNPSQIQTNDPNLNALLAGLSTQNYEEILLPSRGVLYDSPDLPVNGVLHLRPMTGQEESILSTVRFMRGGRGIEMIFKNCIQEKNINTENMLSVDRTFLLVYLRAISYGNMYEVSVRCPDCNHQFDYDIDLNLPIDYCPESFTKASMTRQLPKTGYVFNYQLMTGAIETQVGQYRDHKSKFSNATDDSFIYRASMLITEIGNKDAKIDQRHGIQALIERLPAQDVNYIRNVLNEPPFGVDTEVKVICPACTSQFPVELPYEANFFFPRERIEDTQH